MLRGGPFIPPSPSLPVLWAGMVGRVGTALMVVTVVMVVALSGVVRGVDVVDVVDVHKGPAEISDEVTSFLQEQPSTQVLRQFVIPAGERKKIQEYKPFQIAGPGGDVECVCQKKPCDPCEEEGEYSRCETRRDPFRPNCRQGGCPCDSVQLVCMCKDVPQPCCPPTIACEKCAPFGWNATDECEEQAKPTCPGPSCTDVVVKVPPVCCRHPPPPEEPCPSPSAEPCDCTPKIIKLRDCDVYEPCCERNKEDPCEPKVALHVNE